MATAANDATAQAQEILFVSPDDILIGERIGLYWPDKAAALGRLMAEDGQNDPIKVRKSGPRANAPWTLVAGLHRLEGARLEHLPLIQAIEVFGTPDQYREIEASENIHRRSFAPIERACFVRAIADAAERRMQGQHEGRSQQQIAVRARWDAERAKVVGIVNAEKLAEIEADHTAANLSGVYGWEEGVADAMDLSARSIRRDLALHRALVEPFPHLYRDLARHPIVGENASALRELVAVKDEGQRRTLIETIIAHPAVTVAQAKEMLGMARPGAAPAEGATKYTNNMVSNLGRLSASQQRDAAPAIVDTLKPSALVALRDLLNARIAAERVGIVTDAPAPPEPAVPVRQSVKPDYIACLEDGTRHVLLSAHLREKYGMTPAQYRAKWRLPADYPMTAPNHRFARGVHWGKLIKRLAAQGGAA